MIRRIHVTYRLRIAEDLRGTAEKVHGFHADYCPIARSFRGAIAISTSLEMEPLGE